MYVISRISKQNAIWLACAIDTEGSIFLGDDKRRPTVAVYNTHYGFIEHFEKLSNAIVRKYTPSSVKSTKPMFMATVARIEHVQVLLNAVLPYLIVKKQKALLAIDHFKHHPRQTPKEVQNRWWGNLTPAQKDDFVRKAGAAARKGWARKTPEEKATVAARISSQSRAYLKRLPKEELRSRMVSMARKRWGQRGEHSGTTD